MARLACLPDLSTLYPHPKNEAGVVVAATTAATTTTTTLIFGIGHNGRRCDHRPLRRNCGCTMKKIYPWMEWKGYLDPPNDIRILVLLWKLGSKEKTAQISREEWIRYRGVKHCKPIPSTSSRHCCHHWKLDSAFGKRHRSVISGWRFSSETVWRDSSAPMVGRLNDSSIFETRSLDDFE